MKCVYYYCIQRCDFFAPIQSATDRIDWSSIVNINRLIDILIDIDCHRLSIGYPGYWELIFLSCFSLIRSTRQHCCRVRSWFVRERIWIMHFFFRTVYKYILTREAALSRSDMNSLQEIALNSFLLRLFATKIETNESWIMCEYAKWNAAKIISLQSIKNSELETIQEHLIFKQVFQLEKNAKQNNM